jgi:hypothetical protein
VPAQYLVRYDVPGATATYWQLRGRDTIPVRLIPVAPGKSINLELRNLPGTFREQVEYRLEQARSEPVQNPWWPAGVSEGGASSFAAMLPSRTKLMQAFPGGETDAIRKNVEVGGITTAWSRYVNAWNIYMKRYDAWLEAVLFESACTELYRDLQTVRYSLSDNPEKAREEVLQRTEGLFPGVRENPLLFTRQSLATVSSGTLADSLLNFYAPLRELQPFLPAADSLQQMAFLRQQAVERFAGGEARGLPDVLIRRVGEAYRQLQRESYRRLLPLQVIPQTEAVVLRIWPEADSSVRELLRLPANDTFQRIIPLVRKKPLRFRNSFGMSFVQFSDSRWNYFVRTGSVNVIDREKADFFRPVVATLLHFYAPRDRGFRWGGSIGAGLPLTGDDRNLNILMGLSTFLGREDPISITLGLSGAQVNHLSRYRLGDVVTITELNPKTDFTAVYRLGFFIGITFNPSGLNANN